MQRELRYFDRRLGKQVSRLLPGEYLAQRADSPGLQTMTTVLGSCVSVCLIDPIAKIAGMNHFMLPTDGKTARDKELNDTHTLSARYGAYAMEILINELLQLGAEKRRLNASIFGGANVLKLRSDLGFNNVQFARLYLKLEGITLSREETGGQQARWVALDTANMQLTCHLVDNTLANLYQAERDYSAKLQRSLGSQPDVSVFDASHQ